MAIHQQKRENLLLEATAYRRRLQVKLNAIEFRGDSLSAIFAGQREVGRWSLYFDESPVLQFDEAGRLRRLVILPRKFKVERGLLVEILRNAVGGRVTLETQQVSVEESVSILSDLKKLVERTSAELNLTLTSSDQRKAVELIPEDDLTLVDDLAQFLSGLTQGIRLSVE